MSDGLNNKYGTSMIPSGKLIFVLNTTATVVSWPEFLVTVPEDLVIFPALPNFLSSGPGTVSTRPHEYN
jgi:hypothetical protein